MVYTDANFGWSLRTEWIISFALTTKKTTSQLVKYFLKLLNKHMHILEGKNYMSSLILLDIAGKSHISVKGAKNSISRLGE